MRRYFIILSALAACAEPAPVDDALIARIGGMTINEAMLEARLGEPAERAGPQRSDQALAGLVDEARQAAAAQAAGLESDPAIRARLALARQRVLADAWRARQDAPIAEDAIAERYEAERDALTQRIYDLDFIRVRIEGDDRIGALTRARRAFARVQSGEPFAQVAREFSTDRATGVRGGRLGEIDARRLPALVRDRLEGAQVGIALPPIELPDAVVIARLKREPEDVVMPLSKVAPRLRAQLRREDQQLRRALLAERFPVQTGGAR